MHYLPKKLLNTNPLITAKEQYHLVQVIEGFKSRMRDFLEARKGSGEKFENELPAGDEITTDELNNLIELLSDIENRKRPITRIAYLKALNILQQDIKHLPTLKNIFKEKGLTKNVESPIENILGANTSNQINSLVNYIRGTEQVTASELANRSTPEAVENLFPMLNEGLVKSLFNIIVPAGGGKGTGAGELALILLLKDAIHPVKGDVRVPEGLIEVKQGQTKSSLHGGRLTGAKNIYGDVQSAFMKNFSDIIGNNPKFNTTYWYNLNPSNLELFQNMLEQVTQSTPQRNLREQIVRAYTNSISIYLKDFNPELIAATINNAFDSQGHPLKEELTRGIFKLSFMFYHQTEQFKYFAVFGNNQLLFKTYEDALNSIDTPGGLTFPSSGTPSFQDDRANAFKVMF